MSARPVLLTGASGFIGSHVLPLLARRGLDVHALARRPPAEPTGAIWHAVDLADGDAVERIVADVRPSHLLHLAWDTRPREYYTSPANVDHLAGSLRLLRAFARAGGERFVGAGSSAEYDLTAGSELREDETPLRPNGLYGVCKKALYEVLAGHAARTGASYAWGRVFFCYGPREHPSRLVPTLLRALEDDGRVPFHEGTGIRDYLYVADVAQAFAALLLGDAQGAVNVGSGRPIALRSFVTALATAAGRPDAVDFGARPAPGHEPARVVADVTRLRLVVDPPGPTALDDGLARTVAWWRARWAREPVPGPRAG